ncbi:MAG: thiamine pyrophosphate-binding protein [Proteobacteria bacterium]|nr:thiamine pyrophosphate-binding protein [Pseudomonadota bacterium]
MSMTGGDALVATLLAHGFDTVFGVAGESFLTVLEAFRREQNRIRFVCTRHESGAAFAADGFARFARRPGALFVTRGPGATNASIGIHSSAQDSIPVLLFIGHVPTHSKGIEGFQEIDYHQMYGKIAKAVVEPESAAQVAEATARAVRLARNGRPGPVVVVLPRDVTEGEAGEAAIPADSGRPPVGADPGALGRVAALLKAARNPVMLLGELVHWEDAGAEALALAEAAGASVMAAYRWQSVVPNPHPLYMGHIELNAPPYQRRAWAEFDLVLALGTRLDEATVGRQAKLRPGQKLVHVYPDGEVLARFSAETALMSDVKPALKGLAAALQGFRPPQARAAWQASTHALERTFATPGAARVEGAVDLAQVAAATGRLAPEDSVVVCDSGTFARWIHRYHPWRRPGTYGGSATSAMGYGVPGAIGIRLACPGRTVIAFVGDGGFQMTGQELMTAVEQALPIKVVVCDNGVWGSIMTSQRAAYGPGHDFATRLKGPDFAALGAAFGIPAFKVRTTAEYADALAAALRHDGPALIHLLTDERDISPFGPWDP